MSHTAGNTEAVASKAFPKLHREGILAEVRYREYHPWRKHGVL